MNNNSKMSERTKKILIPIAFVIAIILSSLATNAWLASNKKVDDEGLEMQIDTTSNLIISDDTAEIVKADIMQINASKTSASPFKVINTTNDVKYAPSTHDASYTTGLKYVTNNSIISLTTGLREVGETTELAYADAANVSGGKQFYIDYTVYIASHGNALNDATLKATISSAKKGSSDVSEGSLMATSIDFYDGSVSSGNYKGTLNVAGFDAATNDHSTAKEEVYLIGSDSTTGTIPLNTSAYKTYILRCYFDGALLSGDGQAYINTATLDLSKVTLGVSFEATGSDYAAS